MKQEEADSIGDWHSPQPDGFPDGEGEYVVPTEEFIQAVLEGHHEIPHEDPRIPINIRHNNIRLAARWIADILDTHTVDDSPVGQAIQEIRYKLRWVDRTGMGMEDIT